MNLPSVHTSKIFLLGLFAVVGPWTVYLLSVKYLSKKIESTNKNEEKNSIEIVDLKKIEIVPTITSTSNQVVADTVAVELSDTNKITDANEIEKRKILIIYGTCTGTAKRLAIDLSKKIGTIFPIENVEVKVVDAKDYDEYLLDQEDIVLFICSTWTGSFFYKYFVLHIFAVFYSVVR